MRMKDLGPFRREGLPYKMFKYSKMISLSNPCCNFSYIEETLFSTWPTQTLIERVVPPKSILARDLHHYDDILTRAWKSFL